MAADAAPVEVRDALRDRVRALCGDRTDEVYPYLGRMLSLPLEEEAEARLRGLDAEGLQVLTFRAAETLLEHAARQRPLVIVCEDLHWADPTSLALLEQLLALADRVPVSFVCVLRPETGHGCWRVREVAARDYRHRHVDLWLDPLSVGESERLVRGLLEVEDSYPELAEGLPQALRQRILDYTEGNPFYLEEVLRALIGEGAIARDEGTGRWQAVRDVASLSIPDTLHGVLMARIDSLPRGSQQVLQLAAVIGHVFAYHVLVATVGESGGLDEHLVALQRAQMIREQGRVPELAYAFHHQLTMEAAYGSLLRRKRRALHRRVAEALERLYARRIEEQLGLLAYHWEQAGQAESAVHYLRRAGEQAAAQYANEEAIAYLSRALALTPEDDVARRYALLLVREGIYGLQVEREAQRRDLQTLQQVAQILAGCEGEREGSRRLAEVALREAHYHTSIGDIPLATAAAERTIHLSEVAQDPGLEAAGYLAWGDHDLYLAPETSEAKLQRALALSRAAGERVVEAESLRALGLLSSNRLGDDVRALSYHEQALRVYRRIGDRMGEGRMLDALGVACYGLGDRKAGIAHVEQGLRLCRETGNRHDGSFATVQLGEGFYYQGDYARALALSEQGLELGREIGNLLVQVWAYVHLGMARCALGDYARGRSDLERGFRLAREAGNRVYEAYVGRYLGWAVHFQGDHSRAVACLSRAAAMAREGGSRPVEVAVLVHLGVVYDALGAPTQARACHDQAWEMANEVSVRSADRSPVLQSTSQAYLGLLSHHLGDDDAAREYAWRALCHARDTGALSEQARALTFLGHARAGLGRLGEAVDAYREALALHRQIGQQHLTVEPLAGLARVALAHGDLAAALAHTEEVLSCLEARPRLEGTREPLRVYLTCYRVLSAVEDPRAGETLHRAHHLLQERATNVDDPELRRSFLENVPAHREIAATFHTISASSRSSPSRRCDGDAAELGCR